MSQGEYRDVIGFGRELDLHIEITLALVEECAGQFKSYTDRKFISVVQDRLKTKPNSYKLIF